MNPNASANASSSANAAAADITLHTLHYQYPAGTEVLRGVDLHIPAGQRVAILGPNGAGKTTLALHLNGILHPTLGRIAIGDLPVDKSHMKQVRARVGMVFQDPDDQLFMPTVAQDVAFGPQNFGVSPAEVRHRVDEALAAVGMLAQAGMYPGHLSFGQKRRVAIATVLSCQPQVLVLDEPTSNLDPQARRELYEILCKLPHTIVLVTHDLPFAAQLCARAVVLDEGRIAADTDTFSLLADPELLARHRLELPFGFDPAQLRS